MTARAPQLTVLWERELPASRTRTVRLTAAEIAAAAFGLAESENLSVVSVKRVANRLGVPAPRLEQYLPDRDALHDLMLEHALGEVALPSSDTELDWRAQVEQLATATYAVVQARPWLVELVAGRPATGPNGLRFVERALAAVRGSGLDVASSALVVNAVLAFVAGSVRARAARGTQPGDAEYLAGVVADGPYPQVRELFAAEQSLTADASFTQGLQYLLDGVASRAADPAVAAGGRR